MVRNGVSGRHTCSICRCAVGAFQESRDRGKRALGLVLDWRGKRGLRGARVREVRVVFSRALVGTRRAGRRAVGCPRLVDGFRTRSDKAGEIHDEIGWEQLE